MSILDFLKRKKSYQEQPKESFEMPVEIKTETTFHNDVVPVEKRMQSAFPSRQGLYPHEILLLDYADSYYTDGNNYQGFWWYKYGIKDVDACLRSLLDRGFLKVGDLESAIALEKLSVLKEELKKHGLKVSGKKEELVNRLLTEIPEAELNLRFSRRKYQLTELGEQALREESYVPYIHRRRIDDLDIWSLNRLMYEPPAMSYRDKIWGYLNKKCLEYSASRKYGFYRCCRYDMAEFLIEEKRYENALGMLAEVVFFDLSGLGNEFNMQFLNIYANSFFPYEESSATIAPGVISLIIKCKTELNLSDEELKATMLERIKIIGVPFHLFTPEECVEIALMSIDGNKEALNQIYDKARRRFDKNYPGIRRRI